MGHAEKRSDLVQRSPAVGGLFDLGKPEVVASESWQDYVTLCGLASDDAEALIALAVEVPQGEGSDEDAPDWAPVHAWRALGQLRVAEAVQPLLVLADVVDDDDWAQNDLPRVLGLIGEAAMEPLQNRLADLSRSQGARTFAATALGEVGMHNPATRSACVLALTGALASDVDLDPVLGGIIVGSLLDLRAVESIDLIRSAFARGGVDESIVGDIEDVEIELGLRTARDSAPRNYFLERIMNRLGKTAPAPLKRVKTGRNEACPCGSGKKYKKCCLGK